jgi:3-oxoacyl-[acyl-carrier-protein] synthase II
MGVLAPNGIGLDAFWESILAGRSGIGPITRFDTTDYDCRIAGEVRDFEPRNVFNNPKDVKRTDRFTQMAMGAAKMAMKDSSIDVEKTNRERFGVI